MGSNFPSLLQEAMAKGMLDRRQAVQLLGYRNTNKGLRNLEAWLSGSRAQISKDHIQRIAGAFDLSEADLLAAINQDAEAEVQRRKELRRHDPHYRVTVRLMAAFYLTHKVPGSLSMDEALRQAHGLAEGRFRFAINTPEDQTYFCDESGRIESVTAGNEPYILVKNRPLRLVSTRERV